MKKNLEFLPIFQFFKRFLRKSSKLGHENLVLQLDNTSTVQGQLLTMTIQRTNFLQVLTYYGFSRLLCYDGTKQN